MSPPTDAFVLVHVLGHRDLYLWVRDAQGTLSLVKPSAPSHFSIGKLLADALRRGTTRLRPSASAEASLDPPLPLKAGAQGHARKLENAQGDVPNAGSRPTEVVGIAMPLLGAALAEVRGRLMTDREGECELHCLLLSAGAVRPVQTRGHSTERVAAVMATWLGAAHPDIHVTLHHRDTEDPFVFSDAPPFIDTIDRDIRAKRAPLVRHYGDGWANHFRVAISANTGTLASIVAVKEGLRGHRPELVHLPDASRWPIDPEGGGLRLSRALTLNPDHLAQQPPRSAGDLEDDVERFTVEAMAQWRDVFCERRPLRAGDASSTDKEYQFWFRKGQKEVLALLVTRAADGGLIPHRAVNLEVSLPTGTLCAERNAIGSALAAQPDLRRQDIVAVAVLSLDAKIGPRLGPCGACQEWLRKIAEVNPDFRVITFDDFACTKVYVNPVAH
mgnify:CR=1 FL=1